MSRPPWTDEKKATSCAKCATPFGVFTRKHHCRACGKIFCNICSSNNIQLPQYEKFYGNEAVRVCDTCFYKEKHEALVRAKKVKEGAAQQAKIEQPAVPAVVNPVAVVPDVQKPQVAAPVVQPKVDSPQKPPQKGNSFVSLPTSVRKDLQTQNVINSIFDVGDPFVVNPAPPKNKPSTPSPTPNSTSSSSPTQPIMHQQQQQHNQNQNQNHNQNLNQVPIQTASTSVYQNPYQKKNEATMNAADDIFGNISQPPVLNPVKAVPTPTPTPIQNPQVPNTAARTHSPNQNNPIVSSVVNMKGNPYTSAGVEPKGANTLNEPNINNNTNNVVIHPPSSQQPVIHNNNVIQSTNIAVVSIVENGPPIPPRPINIVPEVVVSTPTPTPIQTQPQNIVNPVVHPAVPQTNTQSVNHQSLNISHSILSMPDPCVVNPFIPPRDGGIQESPKTRSMQEKLFTRWVNFYVSQRGIFLENLGTEFSDGVVFIHLIECYTRVMITDDLKSYCTPYPQTNDDKYLNFYSGLTHLANLQKPMPPVNIQSLIMGDVGTILNLLWALLFRIEIELKTLNGNDGILAILTWVKYIADGFPGINIYDFRKSFEDGLVFNAIICKHQPRVIDFNTLNPANKSQNVGIALGAMCQLWGIPILLDVDDVIDDPDDVCIIIYLSQCYDLVR